MATFVAVLVLGAGAAATASASARAVPKVTELAALQKTKIVYSTPGGRQIEAVNFLRPLSGERTTLPVLKAKLHKKHPWVEVMLPGRPNGLKGWMSVQHLRFLFTPWHIVVETAGRRVLLYKMGRLVRSFGAIVGAPITPTPKGNFFVEETVSVPPTAVGYPYALALSARSNVLQEFAGGPGQIALHGITNIGGVIGTAVSHGCIRLETSAITYLARHADPGVPVTIR